MALTVFEGYEFLQTILKADSTLQASALGNPPRVYQRNAPDGIPTYPLILIRFVSGIPLMTVGAIDVSSSALFDVIMVSHDNSIGTDKDIINQVDEVLSSASGTTTDGTIWFCHKAEGYSEIATTDPPNPQVKGARFQNLGRTWRLEIGTD